MSRQLDKGRAARGPREDSRAFCFLGRPTKGGARSVELEPRLLTVREVCALLRLSRRSVERLMTLSRLPFTRVANRAIRFERADVERYLAERQTPRAGTKAA